MKKIILLIIMFALCQAYVFSYSSLLSDTVEYRIIDKGFKVSSNDTKLLSLSLPYIYEICNIYGLDPLFYIAIIEKESSYKWVYGDNGNAVGFGQIWAKTALFVVHKNKDMLADVGIYNTSFSNESDLYKTPIRTTILSVTYLCYQYKKTGDIISAIGLYNGIDNDRYIADVLEIYAELSNIRYYLFDINNDEL